mmetsp:Transcript_7658/g.10914  ORF Transcript_7658/g.10914 Transcript_7658/m.10914 type:complete len:490 (+) Transcript_7658:27-1496(+)
MNEYSFWRRRRRRWRQLQSGPCTTYMVTTILVSSFLIVDGAFSVKSTSLQRFQSFSASEVVRHNHIRDLFKAIPHTQIFLKGDTSSEDQEDEHIKKGGAVEEGELDINRNMDRRKFQFLDRVKSTSSEEVGESKSIKRRLSKIVETGKSGVISVASSSTSGLVEITSRGTSSVRSAANTAASSLKNLARKGAEDVVSTTSRAKEVAVGGAQGAGEVAKWMDEQARGGVDSVNAKAQSLVLGFTGKNKYQPGDITKELLRRIVSAEYDMNDIALFLKIMVAVGASIGPLAKVLPVTVLLEMLNVSLERQIGGKFLDTLASSLDDRFSAAFSNDDKYQLGDAVRRSTMSAVSNFTGKDSYKSGDIEYAVSEAKNQKEEQKPGIDAMGQPIMKVKTLNVQVGDEFDEWDQKFRETQGISIEDMTEESGMISNVSDMEIVMGLVEVESTTSEKADTKHSSVDMTAKFCIFCGTKLPSVAKYCSSCGEQQPQGE